MRKRLFKPHWMTQLLPHPFPFPCLLLDGQAEQSAAYSSLLVLRRHSKRLTSRPGSRAPMLSNAIGRAWQAGTAPQANGSRRARSAAPPLTETDPATPWPGQRRRTFRLRLGSGEEILYSGCDGVGAAVLLPSPSLRALAAEGEGGRPTRGGNLQPGRGRSGGRAGRGGGEKEGPRIRRRATVREEGGSLEAEDSGAKGFFSPAKWGKRGRWRLRGGAGRTGLAESCGGSKGEGSHLWGKRPDVMRLTGKPEGGGWEVGDRCESAWRRRGVWWTK